MRENAAASRPRSVETAFTAYDIDVTAMRRMPSAAWMTSTPSGFATCSWIARSAPCTRRPPPPPPATAPRRAPPPAGAHFEHIHHGDLHGQRLIVSADQGGAGGEDLALVDDARLGRRAAHVDGHGVAQIHFPAQR